MDDVGIGIMLIAFAVYVFIITVILHFAMKLTKVEGEFIHLFIASTITALVGLIPFVGWLLSPLVLVGLVSFWTTAEVFPDAVLMVVVAWGIGMLLRTVLLGMLV